jgi:tetratricopeptide (TPR) repeat protein
MQGFVQWLDEIVAATTQWRRSVKNSDTPPGDKRVDRQIANKRRCGPDPGPLPLAKNPHSADAHANLASALRALQRHDEAILCYERALTLQPAFAEASYGLAVALLALQRHDEAIGRYETALAIKPGFAEARYGLATAHHALLQYDEAIRGAPG